MEQTDETIQLIHQLNSGDFEVNQEALKILENLNEDQQLGIVSVVGKYRTGKSYFVNKVLINQSEGFQVGSTVNACTRGIWMYKKMVQIQQKNIQMIVLDTEGLNSTDVNKNNDSRIFLIALLLSSYFIYNSVGTIDENSIQELGLIINMAKQLMQNQTQEIEFPQFHWILRDFALQLNDSKGNKIDSKTYLENSVEQLKGVSDQVQQKNVIRKLFKQFFVERECSTLVRPVESEKMIQMLNDLQDYQIRSEFKQQIENIRNIIHKKIRPKQIKGINMNGKLFSDYAQQLVKIFNQETFPNIKSSFQYVIQNQLQIVLKQIEKDIDKQIVQLESQKDIDFFQQRNQMIDQQIQYFIKSSMVEKDIVEQNKINIQKLVQDKFQKFKKNYKNQILKDIQNTYKIDIQGLEMDIKQNEIGDPKTFFEKFDEIKTKILENKDYNKKLIQTFIENTQQKLFKLAIESFYDFQRQQSQKIQMRMQINFENLQEQYDKLQTQPQNNENDKLINEQKDKQINQLRFDFDQQTKQYQSQIEELQKNLKEQQEQKIDEQALNLEKKKVEELNQKLLNKQKNEEELMNQIEQLIIQKQKLITENETVISQNHILQTKVQSDQSEAHLQTQQNFKNGQLNEIIKNLNTQNQKLQQDFQDAVQNNQKLIDDNQLLFKNMVSENQQKQDELNLELSEIKVMNQDQKNQIAALKENLNMKQKEIDEHDQQYKNQILILKEKNGQLENKIYLIKDENKNQVDEINLEYMVKIEDLQKKNQTLMNDLRQLQNKKDYSQNIERFQENQRQRPNSFKIGEYPPINYIHDSITLNQNNNYINVFDNSKILKQTDLKQSVQQNSIQKDKQQTFKSQINNEKIQIDKLQIEITNFQMLNNKDVLYTIRCKMIDKYWEVQRLYNEFKDLYTLIKNIYPHIQFPSLDFSKSDSNYNFYDIKKRQFELFLSLITENQCSLNLIQFQNFIKLDQQFQPQTKSNIYQSQFLSNLDSSNVITSMPQQFLSDQKRNSFQRTSFKDNN